MIGCLRRENTIEKSGLYFYRARYYDPSLGRFVSQDPIGIADDINLYSYTKNNPINYVDPTGLTCKGKVLVMDLIDDSNFYPSKLIDRETEWYSVENIIELKIKYKKDFFEMLEKYKKDNITKFIIIWHWDSRQIYLQNNDNETLQSQDFLYLKWYDNLNRLMLSSCNTWKNPPHWGNWDKSLAEGIANVVNDGSSENITYVIAPTSYYYPTIDKVGIWEWWWSWVAYPTANMKQTSPWWKTNNPYPNWINFNSNWWLPLESLVDK